MKEAVILPPDWSAVLGWLKLARAVRAARIEEDPDGRFFRIGFGGVDNRRNGVNVENSGARKTSCVTSTKRFGESSR